MQVKAGQVLAITEGEYSDYHLVGHMRALVDFDTEEVRELFVSQLTEGEKDECYSLLDKYLPWMIRSEFLDPFDGVTEFYIGSYGWELLKGID